MKVRDSGMPEQSYWDTLFDVEGVLNGLGVDATVRDAVELGCGYGTFTIPVAERISGTLYAFDIEPAMIAATQARLKYSNKANVEVRCRDAIAHGFGMAPASVDAVLLFNILHLENPIELLELSAKLLTPGGRVLAIHWRSDIPTPRGPDLSIRPTPQQINDWAAETGLLVPDSAPRMLPPWHVGLILQSRR
ncbi:MAG: class I SAM-dependent methyltransferase [Opitutus sp.]